jgi:hypothetical protein
MPDDYDERFHQHEDLLRSLTATLVAQHDMNQRQDVINERLTSAIERIDRTLAHVEITQVRVETLLTRLLRTETNAETPDPDGRR